MNAKVIAPSTPNTSDMRKPAAATSDVCCGSFDIKNVKACGNASGKKVAISPGKYVMTASSPRFSGPKSLAARTPDMQPKTTQINEVPVVEK